MMARRLTAVAKEVRGQLVGADSEFGGVGVDTRHLARGSLFVAIRGPHFDGNDFVVDAYEKGAAGALVSRVAEVPLAQVRVRDTRRALGGMAAAWRCSFRLPVVAVTGSNGKTTVKELIAGILRVRRHVCVTQGNLNNDIGLPLTLMELDAGHEALVVELGANHAGEIDYLSGLARPTIGVITNASASHLAGFGSLAGVAAAKGELLDHLPRAGTAVLNADDAFCSEWRARARAQSVFTYGFAASADCTVVGQPAFEAGAARFRMRLAGGETVDVALPLLGRHNVANALAAAAAAEAAGTSPEDIVLGLARARAVHGRMQSVRLGSVAALIDDTYNANPASVRSALDYLSGLPGKRVLVLGEMAELGAEAAALHRQIGEYARDRCDVLIGVGALARHSAEGFGAKALSVADVAAALRAVEPLVSSETTILVKGSRVAGLDRLVRLLSGAGDVAAGGQC
jgi:UDP-N-acetylmuramoyl-tripeptide--D-alanyl-D-alanine ligase